MGGAGNRTVLTLQKCNAAMVCLKILFAYNIFTFSNIGVSSGYPQISRRQVSVIGFNNVSLKCLAEVIPSDCYSNELQWLFFDRPLKSSQKYEIQQRKAKTKCKRVSMITILNLAYADEGTYTCRSSCELDYSISYKSTPIQLKVLSGMGNCVISNDQCIFKRCKSR